MRVVTSMSLVLALALCASPVFASNPEPPAKAAMVEVKAPASQPASQPVIEFPDGVPQNLDEALEAAKQGVEFAKAKNWWGLSALAIFIAMFLMKTLGLFRKIGKRWSYVTVGGLSIAAMLLTKFAGGVSWGAAVAVLTSGPVMALLNDIVKRGVLGKEHKTPV